MNRGIFEKEPGSGVWWIHFHDSEGRRHREKVGRKSDAMRLYQIRKSETTARKKLPANLRPISFATIVESALDWSRHNKRSWIDDERRAKHILQEFGTRQAESIRPHEIEQYIRRSAKAPATQNRLLALFAMIYREAIKNGKVASNPTRSIRPQKINNAKIRFLSPAEEQLLADYIAANLPAYLPSFQIALHTGMRLSEQFGLKWEQVDIERRMITLPNTKNGEPRHIPLNSTALHAFATIEHVSNPYVFLATRTGARLLSPAQWFRHVTKACGLPDVTWHTLRHTFISRLVMAGVDLRTVMALAGHKSMTMTLRYSHLSPEHTASAVERIAAKK